jgi:hypothetical protein
MLTGEWASGLVVGGGSGQPTHSVQPRIRALGKINRSKKITILTEMNCFPHVIFLGNGMIILDPALALKRLAAKYNH